MGCSPPCSSVHGILPTRILEWVAISYFTRCFWSKDLNPSFLHLLVIGNWILYHWATWEAINHIISPWRRSALGIHWKDWCWSWNSNTLATWCRELAHLKRPWCWERLRAGGEGDDRGWDGWMASPTQWTWVWVHSRSWWWTGRPGVLRFVGLQRVGHDWATELNWTKKNKTKKPNSHLIQWKF